MPTRNITALVRKNILNMKPYASARDEFKGDAEVFLDANENPFPSPYNRYPDPLQRKIKERLSEIKGIAPEQIFLGNGSDEAIDLLIRAFCEPYQDRLLIPEPTYGMYAVCAAVNAVQVQQVPLTADFDVDLGLFPWHDTSLKLVFLCSPNNPTGNLLSREKVLAILERFDGLVVIDEAYIDFAGSESFLQQLDGYPNLVILQTLSKAWGLAGLRLGMCFASPEIITILNRIKYPYNINTATQQLVFQALHKVEEKDRWVREIIAQRISLADALAGLPITERVYPSDANFLLVRVKAASQTYRYLMQSGIIVRDRSNVSLCNNCLRITIGTSAENGILLDALRRMPDDVKAIGQMKEK